MPWILNSNGMWIWTTEEPTPSYSTERYYQPPAFAVVPPPLELVPILVNIGEGIIVYLSGKLIWTLGEKVWDNLRARLKALPVYYCSGCGTRLVFAPEYERWYCPMEGQWY